MEVQVLARRVFRTGVQTIELRGFDRFFVTIANRTYSSEVEIPKNRVLAWLDAFECGTSAASPAEVQHTQPSNQRGAAHGRGGPSAHGS